MELFAQRAGMRIFNLGMEISYRYHRHLFYNSSSSDIYICYVYADYNAQYTRITQYQMML